MEGVAAELMQLSLDDGLRVMFEPTQSDLVVLHGGQPDVREGGRLTQRLPTVAEAPQRGRRVAAVATGAI